MGAGSSPSPARSTDQQGRSSGVILGSEAQHGLRFCGGVLFKRLAFMSDEFDPTLLPVHLRDLAPWVHRFGMVPAGQIEDEVLREVSRSGRYSAQTLRMFQSSSLMPYPKDDSPADFSRAGAIPVVFHAIVKAWQQVN